MTQPDRWLDMLREAIAASSQSSVAKRLDLSHTTLSLIVRGKYPAKTDKVAARVLRVLGQVQCTHTGQPISLTVCVSYATRRPPVNNPLEMSHFRTCLKCPLRPVKGDA